MIYFDNAATAGRRPDSVAEAVLHALREVSANPGRSGRKVLDSVSLPTET